MKKTNKKSKRKTNKKSKGKSKKSEKRSTKKLKKKANPNNNNRRMKILDKVNSWMKTKYRKLILSFKKKSNPQTFRKSKKDQEL